MIIRLPTMTMLPVLAPAMCGRSRMKVSSDPAPESWTTRNGTVAERVTTQAATRTARPGMLRASTSPMVNRPALRRGSASRNISSTRDKAVLTART
ncbi:hypothetical protein RKD49_000864 [Streptomyces glaucescens]